MKSLFSQLPRPFPDPDLYESVLEEGFRLYPERKRNHERFQRAERGEVLDYLPIKLDVENVSRCNYKCTMCIVSDWEKGQRAEDMELDDYKRLLDEQVGLVEIKIQGVGEPLMGKTYFEMIDYARQKGIWVRAITNGSLLHLHENYKRIIDSDVCELHVSIDGADQEVYEKIRRGGRFVQVEKNCIMLNNYARSVGRLRTRMWSVVQKDNYHQLGDMVRLAGRWGFDRITFSLDLEDWGVESWKERNRQSDMKQDFTLEYAQELVDIGRAIGVQVTYWATYEKFKRADPEKMCHWPFERLLVSSDMRTVPCCMISQPEIVDMGDAKTLAEVWNSESYQTLRRAHISGEIPDYCVNCYGSEGERDG